jgi:NADPH-dependent ferric siderophore reductase
VGALPAPSGRGHAFAAAESATVKAVRDALVGHGLSNKQIRASAYWRRGDAAHHETLDAGT